MGLRHIQMRITEVNNRALRVAAVIVIFAIYGAALLGAIFDPVVTRIMLILGALFLASYIVAYRIYNSKM